MRWVKILVLFVSCLILVSGVYAASIALSDANLEFVGDPGEEVCHSLIIYSSDPANVVGEDKWSLKDSRNLLDYKYTSGEVNVDIEYPKIIDFNKKEDVNVCLKADIDGTYFGVLMYKNGNVAAGTWIKFVVGNGVDFNLAVSDRDNQDSVTGTGSVVLQPKTSSQSSGSSNGVVIFSAISLVLVIVFVVLIVLYSSKKKKSMVV